MTSCCDLIERTTHNLLGLARMGAGAVGAVAVCAAVGGSVLSDLTANNKHHGVIFRAELLAATCGIAVKMLEGMQKCLGTRIIARIERIPIEQRTFADWRALVEYGAVAF